MTIEIITWYPHHDQQPSNKSKSVFPPYLVTSCLFKCLLNGTLSCHLPYLAHRGFSSRTGYFFTGFGVKWLRHE